MTLRKGEMEIGKRDGEWGETRTDGQQQSEQRVGKSIKQGNSNRECTSHTDTACQQSANNII
jgi:hypothetical protein